MTTRDLTLEFHGGVGEVTGACYLLRSGKTSILIDCGMFQGSHFFENKNFDPFKFDVTEIDALFVTHAHMDHIGRIPKLIKDGFKGRIYSTPETKELSALLLEDGLNFMKEPNVLYREKDIERALAHWDVIPYHEPVTVGGASVVLRNSGHILGSAMAHIILEGKNILFTGDFGNTPSVLLPPPEPMPQGIEYLIIESTYGNKVHPQEGARAVQLERALEDTFTRGGTLMIPSFASERTQDILYELNDMVTHNRVPHMPVYVDSPLATRITEVFRAHTDAYNESVQEMMKKDPHIFDFKGLMFTTTVDESKAINDVKPPKVVVAGSGSSSGGRIIHHERRYLQDPGSILLIVGYQPAGSLGRRLLDGAKEATIKGETIPVRAEIRKISGYSAHADGPQLYSFIEKGKDGLKKIFVVQGEDEAAGQLAQDVKDRLGVSAVTPALYETFELS